MIEIQTSHGTIDMTIDMFCEYISETRRFYPHLDERLLHNETEKVASIDFKLVSSYVSQNGHKKPDSIRILNALGICINGIYMYGERDLDGEKIIPVDEWLEKHDGKYDALFVTACNREGIRLKPRKSIVVYPLSLYKPIDLLTAGVNSTAALTILSPI